MRGSFLTGLERCTLDGLGLTFGGSGGLPTGGLAGGMQTHTKVS